MAQTSPFDFRECSVASLPFGRSSGTGSFKFQLLFKLKFLFVCLFLLCPGAVESVPCPLVLSQPPAICSLVGGDPHCSIVSASPTVLRVVSQSFLFSSPFVQSSLSSSPGEIALYVGKELVCPWRRWVQVFPCHHLGPSSNAVYILDRCLL